MWRVPRHAGGSHPEVRRSSRESEDRHDGRSRLSLSKPAATEGLEGLEAARRHFERRILPGGSRGFDTTPGIVAPGRT